MEKYPGQDCPSKKNNVLTKIDVHVIYLNTDKLFRIVPGANSFFGRMYGRKQILNVFSEDFL